MTNKDIVTRWFKFKLAMLFYARFKQLLGYKRLDAYVGGALMGGDCYNITLYKKGQVINLYFKENEFVDILELREYDNDK